MNVSHPTRRILLFFVLMWPLLACGLIDVPDLSDVPLIGDPTPIPSPTPEGDAIVFRTLTYRTSLSANEVVPGTGMRFLGAEEESDGYLVSIDGLTATKRGGDSFSWRGVVAPAAVGKYDLRLVTTNILSGELLAVGTVDIFVLDPVPLELQNFTPPAAALEYEELVVNYVVPVGHTIPGTTMTYLGNGEQGAELTGFNGYPYFRQADSLTWTGQLRENIILRYDLRVVLVNDDSLHVAGFGKLWVYDN